MALDYNPHFVPIRTRKLILSEYLNGNDIVSIAQQHSLQPSTIKTYIRRYQKTVTVDISINL